MPEHGDHRHEAGGVLDQPAQDHRAPGHRSGTLAEPDPQPERELARRRLEGLEEPHLVDEAHGDVHRDETGQRPRDLAQQVALARWRRAVLGRPHRLGEEVGVGVDHLVHERPADRGGQREHHERVEEVGPHPHPPPRQPLAVRRGRRRRPVRRTGGLPSGRASGRREVLGPLLAVPVALLRRSPRLRGRGVGVPAGGDLLRHAGQRRQSAVPLRGCRACPARARWPRTAP